MRLLASFLSPPYSPLFFSPFSLCLSSCARVLLLFVYVVPSLPPFFDATDSRLLRPQSLSVFLAFSLFLLFVFSRPRQSSGFSLSVSRPKTNQGFEAQRTSRRRPRFHALFLVWSLFSLLLFALFVSPFSPLFALPVAAAFPLRSSSSGAQSRIPRDSPLAEKPSFFHADAPACPLSAGIRASEAPPSFPLSANRISQEGQVSPVRRLLPWSSLLSYFSSSGLRRPRSSQRRGARLCVPPAFLHQWGLRDCLLASSPPLSPHQKTSSLSPLSLSSPAIQKRKNRGCRLPSVLLGRHGRATSSRFSFSSSSLKTARTPPPSLFSFAPAVSLLGDQACHVSSPQSLSRRRACRNRHCRSSLCSCLTHSSLSPSPASLSSRSSSPAAHLPSYSSSLSSPCVRLCPSFRSSLCSLSSPLCPASLDPSASSSSSHSCSSESSNALPPAASLIPQTNLLLLVAYDGTDFSGWAANLSPQDRTLVASLVSSHPESSARLSSSPPLSCTSSSASSLPCSSPSSPPSPSSYSPTTSSPSSCSPSSSTPSSCSPSSSSPSSCSPSSSFPSSSSASSALSAPSVPRGPKQLRTVEWVLRQAFAAVHPLSRQSQRDILSFLRSGKHSHPSPSAQEAAATGNRQAPGSDTRDDQDARGEEAEEARLQRDTETKSTTDENDAPQRGVGAAEGARRSRQTCNEEQNHKPHVVAQLKAGTSQVGARGRPHKTSKSLPDNDAFFEAFVERRRREWDVLLSEVKRAENQARASFQKESQAHAAEDALPKAAKCASRADAPEADNGRVDSAITVQGEPEETRGKDGAETVEGEGGCRHVSGEDQLHTKDEAARIASRMPLVAPPVVLRPASRTDRGVHAAGAICQYVSYYHPLHIPLESFVAGVNRRLPSDVRILAGLDLNLLAQQGVFQAFAKSPSPTRHDPEAETAFPRIAEGRESGDEKGRGVNSTATVGCPEDGEGNQGTQTATDRDSAAPAATARPSSPLRPPACHGLPPPFASPEAAALCAGVPTVYQLARGKHYTYFLSLAPVIFPPLRNGCWVLAEDPRLRNWALQMQNVAKEREQGRGDLLDRQGGETSSTRGDAARRGDTENAAEGGHGRAWEPIEHAVTAGARATFRRDSGNSRARISGLRRTGTGETDAQGVPAVTGITPLRSGNGTDKANSPELFSLEQRKTNLFKVLAFDLEQMKQAAKAMEGLHSFAAFRCEYSGKEKARHLMQDNPFCVIDSIRISPLQFDPWPQPSCGVSSARFSEVPVPKGSPGDRGEAHASQDPRDTQREDSEGGATETSHDANERLCHFAGASVLSQGSAVFASPSFTDGHDLPQGLRIDVVGNRFLYKMVRKMVGALVQVALGRLSTEDIRRALELGRLLPRRHDEVNANDVYSKSSAAAKDARGAGRRTLTVDSRLSSRRKGKRGNDEESRTPSLSSLRSANPDIATFRDSGILCAPPQGLTLQKVFLPDFIENRLYISGSRSSEE
uniref:Pseudouridine synthase I TruA alpha/beta domain-containing protein n=1 Tax=Neospora caninum (strain Liverpool) TaxID=572307 RepID=A0A0F7UA78_NEOCL|nr:TPA: hypothetical protein BN1204_011510 [Neospora caninum Liverpool]